MKVFEVIIERCDEDSTEVINSIQYVTSEEDTIKSVTDYFTMYYHDLDQELKSVKEILVIIQHIPNINK